MIKKNPKKTFKKKSIINHNNKKKLVKNGLKTPKNLEKSQNFLFFNIEEEKKIKKNAILLVFQY